MRGRGRGRGRVVVAMLGGLVVAYVVVAGVPVVGGTTGSAPVLDGYPQRIGFERPAPGLPARPGPLAATMVDNDFGNERWLGVGPHGDLWTIPPGPDVLSADGRLLLTTTGGWEDRQLVVHDLTTGAVDALDVAGPAARDPGRSVPYHLDSTRLVQFSPDTRTVLGVFGPGGFGAGGHARLLDVATRVLTDLGPGSPAGFLATGEAVTVRWPDPDRPGDTLEVTATEPGTRLATESSVALDGPWRGDPRAPLSASVSPEGTLALVEGRAGPGRHQTLRVFSLADGGELAPRAVDDWDGCALSWRDGDPVVPVAERGFRFSLEAGAVQVGPDGSQRLVAVHHRMQSRCLRLASDALAVGPHRALLGTTTALWSWYAWQLALAAALALLVLGLAARHWHERGRRVPWRRA